MSVDGGLLAALDSLVQSEEFESRSAAMEAAVQQLLDARVEDQYERALASVTPADVADMWEMAEEGMDDWSAIVVGGSEW